MTGADPPLRGRDLFAAGFLSAKDFAADAHDAGDLPEAIGPYRVEERLGEGGMATVYRVHDPERGCSAALKLLKADVVVGPAYERFRREAQALAKVRHRHVVRVHVVGKAEEGPFLLLELVEGESLAALCAAGPRDPAEAARWTRDLAGAAAAVHAAGIVHRDLKPSNVIVQDGIPVLLDFGVARDADAETLTQDGAVLGTPAYMAPEQAKGGAHNVDARADVYGLGCLLYAMLTGQAPFQGGAVQVLNAVLHHEPEPLRVRNPEVPGGLEAICRRAMAKDPSARYAGAEALADDLERFLAGGRPRALGGRRRLWVGAGGLVLLALVGAAAWRTAPGAAAGTSAPSAPVEGAERPAPLWALQPGEVLPFRVSYRERALGTAMALEVWFRADAAGPPGGALRLGVRVEALTAEFKQDATDDAGLAIRFDSRQPTPASHPLSAMRNAVGMSYAFTLDPQDGGVSRLTGMAPIARAVESLTGPETPLLQAETYRRFCRRAFSDAFIGRALSTLLHLRGAGRPLPWVADGRRGYTLRRPAPGPSILSPLTPAWSAKPEHRYRVRGVARRDGGVLREVWVEQTQVGSEPLRCRARWAFYSP